MSYRSMQEDSNVKRRVDQMLLLLGRRPKLPLSSANVFLVSCANPRQVSISPNSRKPSISLTLMALVSTGFRRVTPIVSNIIVLISYRFPVPVLRNMALKIICRYTVYTHVSVKESTYIYNLTLLLNENFLTSNLDLFLNNFSLLPPS